MTALRANWTGEQVEVQVPTYDLDEPKEIVVTGSAIDGGRQSLGTVRPGEGVKMLYHRPADEGWVFAKTADNVLSKPYVADGDFTDSSAVVETSDSPLGRSPDPEDDPDPSEYAMVVNADNQSGVAFAPAAVREGLTADPSGTRYEAPDGTTFTVYPRQEADETVRDTETGEPVETPAGPGGVETDGGGMIGTVLLVAGGIAAAVAYLWGGR
jgi:hypothetical protein